MYQNPVLKVIFDFKSVFATATQAKRATSFGIYVKHCLQKRQNKGEKQCDACLQITVIML